jgi:hypothetical protein
MTTISLVYDYDSIRSALPSAEPAAPSAPVPDDRRLLDLFEKWKTAFRHAERKAGEDDRDNAVDEVMAIEEEIAGTPAEGMLGMAVKVFLLCRDGFIPKPGGRDPCALSPSDGNTAPLYAEMAISAVRDIARLVPELAPLCTPALAAEAQPED